MLTTRILSQSHARTRRRGLVLAFSVLLLSLVAGVSWPAGHGVRVVAPPVVRPPAPIAYRELQWEDLSPKEWDPTKRLRRADGSLISDADPRARAMLDDLRAIWDNAPTVGALNGAAIRLPGYVVPLDEVGGRLVEFLLVPYFGACIHTPPPPANQIVHVMASVPIEGLHAMDAVWVSGVVTVGRQESPMGTSGYAMQAMSVEPYRAPTTP